MSIVQDVAKLTTISEKALNKLVDKAVWCMCDAVENNSIAGKSLTELDIGFGTINILDTDNEIKYNFTPSADFEKAIRETLIDHKNPLTLILEKTLVNMITKTYKDII